MLSAACARECILVSLSLSFPAVNQALTATFGFAYREGATRFFPVEGKRVVPARDRDLAVLSRALTIKS